MGLTRIRAEQISDIDYKQAVRVISTSNVTLSGGAPSTVDGVSLNAGDRILVAGQSTGSQNGLYDVTVVGTGSSGTWVRTSDANTTGEINAGMIVMVTEGNTYADTSWKLVTNDPIVIGTTSLEFLQNTGNSFSIINVVGSANVVANGVSSTVSFASGNNFSVIGNNTSDVITFSVSQSPSFTGNVTAPYFYGNGINLTGLANVTFGNVPPSNAIIGDTWIDSTSGVQYLYYNDITGNIWAEMEAQTAYSSTGYANLTTNTLNTQVLYNSANAIVGSNNLTFDGTTLATVNLTAGNLAISNSTITNQVTNGNLNLITNGTGEVNMFAHSLDIYSYSNTLPTFQISNTGTTKIYAPVFNSAVGALAITGSTDGNTQAPQNVGVMLAITGQPSYPSRIYNDGANTYAAFIGRAYYGNVNVPTQVPANTVVSRFGATPYANGSWPSISTTRIDMVTTENQTTANLGSQINFAVTPQGSNAIATVMSIANSNVTISGNVVTNNLAPLSGGNIYITGNLLPSTTTYNLGLPTVPWQNAYFGANSITILDNTGNIGNAVTIENNAGNITMGTVGFTITPLGCTTPLFTIAALSGQIYSNANTIINNSTQAANTTSGSLQTAGGAGIAKNLYVGGNTNIAGNLSVSGTTTYSSIIGNVVSASGNVYIAGNLSVAGTVNFVPATYGTFANTSNITAATNNTPAVILWNTAIANSGVTYSAGNSRITVTKTGTYNFTYTAMFNGNGGSPIGYVWLRLNGTDVANSMATGSTTGSVQVVITGGAPINITANQYVEVVWAIDNKANGNLVAFAANSSGFTHPASPSVTLTVMPTGV